VSGVDAYLAELGAALRVRGATRRRFLRECRDHLADAAAEYGTDEAVRRFGPAATVAAEFDAEVAARRGVRATYAAATAVLATGGSTLALIHAATPGIDAPTVWVIAFFIGAQVAAVAAGLALVQALASRRGAIGPAEVMLLVRRDACALVAAGVTMFAAGAALPGRGAAVLLLAGPALAAVAFVAVLRARALARRLDGAGTALARPPLEDLGRLTGLPIPSLTTGPLLALTTLVAAAAAFARDRGEHAALAAALTTAGVEALAVVACFAVLGRALGLRR
jgi:HAAS